MSLAPLFASLSYPVVDGGLPSFTTVLIGNGPHRLGKDTSGSPALLVSLVAGAAANAVPPVELEHITVQYGVRCRLLRDGTEPEAATVTLIRCRETDRVLHGYFLDVVQGVLPLLGPVPSEARVREVVAALIELFRALELPPRKTTQGLWGELYLIAQAADPTALVSAWHATPDEPYDFCAAGQRVEVKSASGDKRGHYFSLQQLHPPADTIAVIASMFAERSGGGVSLGELLERARLRIAARPDLALRLDQVVAATLGQSWRNGLSQRFDWQRAQGTLAFFDAATIPSIRPADVPTDVSEVRFRSELSAVLPIAEAVMRGRGGLLQGVLPLRARARP